MDWNGAIPYGALPMTTQLQYPPQPNPVNRAGTSHENRGGPESYVIRQYQNSDENIAEVRARMARIVTKQRNCYGSALQVLASVDVNRGGGSGHTGMAGC